VVKQVRRGVAVVVGAVAIGVLAVACSAGAAISPGTSGTTSLVGFAFQVPTVTLPFDGPTLTKPAMVTTQTQDQVQGVTHSGEGCPLSLQGN
jgi:hypothetical protein